MTGRTARGPLTAFALLLVIAVGIAVAQPWAAAGDSARGAGKEARTQIALAHRGSITQVNKQIVRRFNELAFRDGRDAEALALVDESYTNYEAGGVTTKRDALERLLAAFPGDPSFELDAVFGEKDLVTVRYEGVFNGTPTIGIDIYRVKNGKLVEHWDSFALPAGAQAP